MKRGIVMSVDNLRQMIDQVVAEVALVSAAHEASLVEKTLLLHEKDSEISKLKDQIDQLTHETARLRDDIHRLAIKCNNYEEDMLSVKKSSLLSKWF